VDEWTLGDPALKMLTATAACVVSLTVSMVGQSPRRDAPAVLQVLGEKYRGHATASDLGLDGILLAQRRAKFFQ